MGRDFDGQTDQCKGRKKQREEGLKLAWAETVMDRQTNASGGSKQLEEGLKLAWADNRLC